MGFPGVGRRAVNTQAVRRGYIDISADAASGLSAGQLHYRRAGTEGRPAIVLLHQTPSTSQMYELLMQALADEFDLIALDTPGFGGSDLLTDAFSVEKAAEALSAAVASMLSGPCYWFGHHTGAALALQIVHQHPEQAKRLAMSGPCLLNEQLKQRLPQIAANVPMLDDGSHMQTIWARISGKDGEASLALRQRETISGLDAGAAYAAAYASVTQIDTEKQLRALRCPTLVFAGTQDPLYPQLESAYSLLADGQKAEIDGAKTFVCERNVDEVAALLRQFFGGGDV